MDRGMAMRTIMMFGAAVLAAGPATAQEKLREFCADRPGLGTPACTVDKGHLQVELGLGDWTLDKQADSRTDTILAGDVSLRYGIGDTTELRLGWTGYGHVRVRDRATGVADRTSGMGDVTVGIKQNLAHPDGDGFSIALLPFATLPTGRNQVGAGDWGAGLLVPVTYALNRTFTLELTPEIDAAVDEDGNGRHLAYGGVVGLQAKLGEKAGIAAELQATRDRDPDQHATMTTAGLSFAYQPQGQSQFDIGVNAGLNHEAPDLEVYFGVSRKF